MSLNLNPLKATPVSDIQKTHAKLKSQKEEIEINTCEQRVTHPLKSNFNTVKKKTINHLSIQIISINLFCQTVWNPMAKESWEKENSIHISVHFNFLDPLKNWKLNLGKIRGEDFAYLCNKSVEFGCWGEDYRVSFTKYVILRPKYSKDDCGN